MNGHLVLAVALGALGYATWAWFHPFRPCPRCQGRGTNRMSTRRRTGNCARCGGTRKVKTLGAQLLHRAVRSAVKYNRDRKDR
ncbi:MAG: hypothetical protein ACRDPO_38640 [Streptosporangiaceae bacterium]